MKKSPTRPLPRRSTPTYRETARRMRAVARRHGPLGVAVPAADPNADGWTGPVVRLGELTDAERIAIGGRVQTVPSHRPTSVGICRCPTCTHWRDESPTVRCSTCGVFSLSTRVV